MKNDDDVKLKELTKDVKVIDGEMEFNPSIRALVRFLARRAAEKDYKELLEVMKSKPEYGIVSCEKEKP